MADDSTAKKLRGLPKVDQVLAEPALEPWAGSELATGAVRAVLDRVRADLKDGVGRVPDRAQIAELAARDLARRFAPQLRRLVNGTGIIVHTNLGRAPLGDAAIDAMVEAARGYSTLEYDLPKGRRGSRHHLVRELLLALTGAEDALVANNNAAALLLALTALARRKQVVVSRGQLVEIGGSFRIPDICRVSGAKMVEVGTTNRTRLSDFEEAVSERTGVLLRVHPSNFRVVGFTEEATLEQLVRLGAERGIPVVDDLGSGALLDISKHTPLAKEPLVAESVAAGASVVTFSGDKLLGGPQAGIAVGRKAEIAKMRKHPLMRAVRPDKLTFAALDATLRAYLVPRRALDELPVWRMLAISIADLEAWGSPLLKAVASAAKKAGFEVDLAPSQACSGGGSLPEEQLPSVALRFRGSPRAMTSLQKALRLGEPGIIGYLRENALWFDLRTMVIEEPEGIVEGLLKALDPSKR